MNTYAKYCPDKLNLVLDLDETLIYSFCVEINETPFLESAEYNHIFFEVTNETIKKHYFFLRPYLIPFLKKLSLYYNLILYTNAKGFYTNKIITYINKCLNNNTNIFTAIYYRLDNRVFLKTLERLQNLNPNINTTNTIIIDDNRSAWANLYHGVLYEIPHYTIYNKDYFSDKMLELLYEDLIHYHFNKLLNSQLTYKLLPFTI